MSLTTIAIVALLAVGLFALFADPIAAAFRRLRVEQERTACIECRTSDVRPAESAEARRDRLLVLLQLIRDCEAAGAKGAASKLRTAAASLVDDAFLSEVEVRP